MSPSKLRCSAQLENMDIESTSPTPSISRLAIVSTAEPSSTANAARVAISLQGVDILTSMVPGVDLSARSCASSKPAVPAQSFNSLYYFQEGGAEGKPHGRRLRNM